jgi:uncharacterized protein (TIGR02147 family)
MARRLGISKQKAHQAVERLVHLGLLKRVGKTLVRTYKKISTSDGVVNNALRKSHFENLQLAQTSLEVDSIHKRRFFACTAAISPEVLPKLQETSRRAVRRITRQAEDYGKPTEVYKFLLCIYPITRKNGGKNV